MKAIKSILPVILILAIVVIFLFRPEILTAPLYENNSMPLGTMISWFGIVAVAWISYLIRPMKKRLLSPFSRNVLYLNFFAAVFWGFISYLLAGNWQFKFLVQLNFYLWILYTAAIFIIPVIVYTIWLIKRNKK